jgi:hypothetical protein
MHHDIDCDFDCNICNGDGEGSQSNTGWLDAIRGPKRDQLLEEKFQLLRSKNENKGEPLPLEWNDHTSSDEVIEKKMIIQTPLDTVNKQIHNNHKNPRDVRRFKKNQVKTVEDREVCRISDMRKVLPKESEVWKLYVYIRLY